MEQPYSIEEGSVDESQDSVIDLRTDQPFQYTELQQQLEKEFPGDMIALTRNLSMVVGLAARWSPQSRFRYTRPVELESIEPFSDHLEAEYLVHLGLMAEAGRDRIDGMFGFITPYHHIYDQAFDYGSADSHTNFVDTIELVRRTKKEWREHSHPADVEHFVANFDRMMCLATDADFQHAVAIFVKTGESLPSEQYYPLLARAYIDGQYWKDMFDMEQRLTAAPFKSSPEQQHKHEERLEAFLDWVHKQSEVVVES